MEDCEEGRFFRMVVASCAYPCDQHRRAMGVRRGEMAADNALNEVRGAPACCGEAGDAPALDLQFDLTPCQ